ncbi:MAG TPA: diaminopimelate epimerase [Xanthomonadales bacterium]|nr:diaminopimelate epimerase [Xanthomonadales bacterium]
MATAFTKMHGAGNDFVVVDRRRVDVPLPPDRVRALGDRHTGVGFDQLLTLERAREPGSVAAYRIYNTDGSDAEQCGNGVRCLVAWLARDGAVAAGRVRLDGPAGPVDCEIAPDGRVRVAMGVPRFAPAEVPFDAAADAPLHAVELDGTRVELGVASMGNPHAVLEVADAANAPVATLGPALERHVRFPQRVNVGFAQVLARDAIRLRVFERGVGETLACGSGACAAVAVLARRGRVGQRVAVTLPGGTLDIEWAGDGAPIVMSGPTAFVYEGRLPT